jgi:hypothetical protein
MTTLASAIVESSAWAALTVLAMTITSSASEPVLARRRQEAVDAQLDRPEVAQLFAEAMGRRGASARPPGPTAVHARASALGSPAPLVPPARPRLTGATASTDPRVPALTLPGNRVWEPGGSTTQTGVQHGSAAPVWVGTRWRWVA